MELVHDFGGELTARPEEAGALLAALFAARETRNTIAISVKRNGNNSPVATINANCAHCPMTAVIDRLTATIEQLTATIERLTAKGGAA